jgi:hypothetical protein
MNVQTAGAAAVIIVDDGQCLSDLSFCGIRICTPSDGGFSCHDSKDVWSNIKIPAVIINQYNGNKLKQLMNVKKVKIPGLGYQNVSHYELEDEEEDGPEYDL